MNAPLKDVLRACLSPGEDRAWQELLARTKTLFGAVLLRTARRYGASQDRVQDLAQILYLKLFDEREKLLRLLEKCSDDQAVLAYLAAMAANVARDYFKSQSSNKRGGKVLVSAKLNFENTPSATDANTIERSVLLRQIEVKVEAITFDSPRDRMIFWLYYRQGFTSAAISAIPAFQLTTKGVESILNRLTRKLREEMLERNDVSADFREGIAAPPAFIEGEEFG